MHRPLALPYSWTSPEARSPWPRWAVAVAVVLLSAVCAYAGPRLSLLVLLAGLGAAGLLAILRWPPLGLALVIVGGLFVPFEIATNSQTGLNPTVLLLPVLVGLWLLAMLARRQAHLLPSRPIRPLLILSGVALLAFVNGLTPSSVFDQTAPLRAQVGGLFVFLLSTAAFLLVAHQVQTLAWLQRLTWLFLGIGALYVAAQLFPPLQRLAPSLFLASVTAQSMFWTWLTALAFSQALFNRALRLGWRLALMGLVLAALYRSLVTAQEWVSGWLPCLVALAFILWASQPRLGIVAALGGGLFVIANAPRVMTALTDLDPGSYFTRLEIAKIVLNIVKDNPLLGLGPANYYWYNTSVNLSWCRRCNSHNNYLDLVAQLGLLGLIAFVWFAWETGWLGWRLRSRAPLGFARAYVYGVLGGLGGTLVAMTLGDWFLPFVYNITLNGLRASIVAWLFLGGLVSLQHMLPKDKP